MLKSNKAWRSGFTSSLIPGRKMAQKDSGDGESKLKEFHYFDNCPICQELKKQGIKLTWNSDEPETDSEDEGHIGLAETPESQFKLFFSLKDILSTRLFPDAKMFLEFVSQQSPKLTTVNKNLTRKDIYYLNSQLKKPDQLVLNFGEKIYRLQTERQAHTVHLLNILCQLGRLTRKYRNRIRITRKGTSLLKKSKRLYFHLWQTYLFHFNWAYLVFDQSEIEELQDNFRQIARFLLTKKDQWVKVKEFIFWFFPHHQATWEELRKKKKKTDEERDRLFHIELLLIPVGRALLSKLEYFGLIGVRERKDRLGDFQIISFRLAPLGEKVLKSMFF